MVATAAQTAARRANARLFTGLHTPEGRAASSQNALTHGAHASDDTVLVAMPHVYFDSQRTHRPAGPALRPCRPQLEAPHPPLPCTSRAFNVSSTRTCPRPPILPPLCEPKISRR